MKVGDKIHLKIKQTERLNRQPFLKHKGYISNISDNVIVVMYVNKNEKDLYRESFKISDVIEKRTIIEIKECDKWRTINQVDFMEMRKNAERKNII